VCVCVYVIVIYIYIYIHGNVGKFYNESVSSEADSNKYSDIDGYINSYREYQVWVAGSPFVREEKQLMIRGANRRM
jgi:hypothetical protein